MLLVTSPLQMNCLQRAGIARELDLIEAKLKALFDQSLWPDAPPRLSDFIGQVRTRRRAKVEELAGHIAIHKCES